MDYVAISQPRGIFYNSKDKISGGVRYYEAEKKIVQIKTASGKEKIIVYIDPVKAVENKQIKPENSAENYDDQENRKRILAERLQEIEKTFGTMNEEYQYKEQELSTEPVQRIMPKVQTKETNSEAYIINIAGTPVNFSEQGIEKPYLSPRDRRWLIQAQHYFIKAQEDGRSIGSAEEYTSIDILEGLWSTAESIGINPRRFLVQLYNESRFNPYVKGDAGERGIGQFKESTAKHYGYNWDTMTAGIESYAYQAKAAAEFVRAVGEIAYNGGGQQAERYQNRIDDRLENISRAPSDCVMANLAYCNSSDS